MLSTQIEKGGTYITIIYGRPLTIKPRGKQQVIGARRDLGNCVIWNKYSFDVGKGVYSGNTVMIDAIQWAEGSGFKNIYLLGCDCDYSGKHHFDGRTTSEIGTGKGAMASGNYKAVFDAYEVVNNFTRANIYNCTVDSKLKVFPFKRLEDVV